MKNWGDTARPFSAGHSVYKTNIKLKVSECVSTLSHVCLTSVSRGLASDRPTARMIQLAAKPPQMQ